MCENCLLQLQCLCAIMIIVNEREVNPMRKNEVVEFIIGVVAFFFFFIALPGIAGHFEHHYNREAEVVEISGDVIIVEDACGFEWEFFGNGFEVGQKVKMRMFTNYTHENIFDDEIKKVEIRG